MTKEEKSFFFTNDSMPCKDQNVYLAEIHADIDSAESLLRELDSELGFPNYFGHNWNAVDECITDLSWIDQYCVEIWHHSFPNLPELQAGTYLMVLNDAVKKWNQGGGHSLKVYFLEKDEEKIKSIVSRMSKSEIKKFHF